MRGTTLAKVLHEHYPRSVDRDTERISCNCMWGYMSIESWAKHMAEEIEREIKWPADRYTAERDEQRDTFVRYQDTNDRLAQYIKHSDSCLGVNKGGYADPYSCTCGLQALLDTYRP